MRIHYLAFEAIQRCKCALCDNSAYRPYITQCVSVRGICPVANASLSHRRRNSTILSVFISAFNWHIFDSVQIWHKHCHFFRVFLALTIGEAFERRLGQIFKNSKEMLRVYFYFSYKNLKILFVPPPSSVKIYMDLE